MFEKHRKTLRNTWYKKAIFSNMEKIAFWSLYGFIFAFTFLILDYFFDWKFMWENVSPFEVPTLPVRVFLSALAFVWPWKLLYHFYFYKLLYFIAPSYKKFKEWKSNIWSVLMAYIAFVFIPACIEFLNYCASLVFNFFSFLIFLLPSFWISLLLTLIWILGYVKWKKSEVNIVYNDK